MTGVYLDYNATSIPRPSAVAAAYDVLRSGGNPSSVHASGRAARARLEDARQGVADLVKGEPKSVIFTSGATEANALALSQPGIDRVIASGIEHDSVLAVVGDDTQIPVSRGGRIDVNALADLLAQPSSTNDAILVAVMAVNNETGVIQPVREVAELAAAHGARLHIDAVQAAGRVDLDMKTLGRVTLSLSAHKIGGPAGVGALIHSPDIVLESLIKGGGQERRMRAGTENLSGIVGFAAAARETQQAKREDQPRIKGLRDRLERELSRRVPHAIVVGSDVPRATNTSCISMPGLTAERQVIALDLAGVQVSAGSACSSGKVTRSHVLSAMGLGDDVSSSAIRVSLGWATTDSDIDRFLDAYQRLAAKAAA